MAVDLTTPLVYQFDRSDLARNTEIGFFNPDQLETDIGICLTHHYDPDKIPILFIHGLHSSPKTWMGMINTIQGDPVLRERYQFWVASYPTGYPVPLSALYLRQQLRELREQYDPEHDDVGLNQMVVVGHSMGGLVARTMIIDPGETIYDAVYALPLEQLAINDEEKVLIREGLKPKPEPSIRRVIFLAAPHRGSRLANQLIGRFGSILMRRSHDLEQLHDDLLTRHGEAVFRPTFRGRPISSIDNLKWGSPLLQASVASPTAPGVPYHSIIGVLGSSWFHIPGRGSDGVVGYRSAHLDEAISELVVDHGHFLTAESDVIAEVHRILTDHLATIDQRYLPPLPPEVGRTPPGLNQPLPALPPIVQPSNAAMGVPSVRE